VARVEEAGHTAGVRRVSCGGYLDSQTTVRQTSGTTVIEYTSKTHPAHSQGGISLGPVSSAITGGGSGRVGD
jgi:hypothetical protein